MRERSISLDEFNSGDFGFDEYKDIEPPPCFRFVFETYLELYKHSNEVITWTDIASYMSVRDLALQQIEIDFILKINVWANNEIYELRKNED